MNSNLQLKDEPFDDDRIKDRERLRRTERHIRYSSNSRDRSPIRERKKRDDCRVFVSNIAYESRWQDVKDLFREHVGEVTFVNLFNDPTDKPTGCGIIEFETPELAARAVEKMHRFDIKGRKLVVKEEPPDLERDKYGRPLPTHHRIKSSVDIDLPNSSSLMHRNDGPRGGCNSTWDNFGNNQVAPLISPSGSGGNNNWGNLYGLNVVFLENLGINGPLVNKVFVANLDYKVDDKKLREVFKLAGKVINTDLAVDKDGKSRGFAVVEYEHPVEAVQAISLLDKQSLYDRKLAVRLDRADKPDGPPRLPEGLRTIGSGLGPNGTILHDIPSNLPPVQQQQPVQPSIVNFPPEMQSSIAAVAAAQMGRNQAVNPHQISNLAGPGGLPNSLGGVGNFLGQSLNVSDLAKFGTNSGFGPSPLNQNQTFNSGMGSNMCSNLIGSNAINSSGGVSSFNHSNSPFIVGSSGYNSSNSGGSGFASAGRDFDSMSAALSGGSGNYGGMDRDNYRGSGNMLNMGGDMRNFGNGSLVSRRDSQNSTGRGSSDTVLIKNLPSSLGFSHLIKDKCEEFGAVKDVQMLSKDRALVQFANPWDAEKTLDTKSESNKPDIDVVVGRYVEDTSTVEGTRRFVLIGRGTKL